VKPEPKRKGINKGDSMSDLTKEDKLKFLKEAHDLVASAVQVLTTRVQYYHEEFEGMTKVVGFLRTTRDEYRKEIELIEPPAPKEAPKAHVMDLTHIKGSSDESATQQ
jgi:hypothetical protein